MGDAAMGAEVAKTFLNAGAMGAIVLVCGAPMVWLLWRFVRKIDKHTDTTLADLGTACRLVIERIPLLVESLRTNAEASQRIAELVVKGKDATTALLGNLQPVPDHAFNNSALEMSMLARIEADLLLIDRESDPSIKAALRGHLERARDVLRRKLDKVPGR